MDVPSDRREALRLIREAITAQEKLLGGSLSVDELATVLAPLRERERFLTAALLGSGAIAQGDRANAVGERGILAKHVGIAITGDGSVNVVLTPGHLRRLLGRATPSSDLRKAAEKYLQFLIERHRYLDFRGMGTSERIPLRLALEDLYVPLNARTELPEGEAWDPDERLAGRALLRDAKEAIAGRPSEPMPVLDLLEKCEGLVILGDPGAGKTTFLKRLTLQLAAGKNGRECLPVLLPLSAYANALVDRDWKLSEFLDDYFSRQVDVEHLPIGELLQAALGTGTAVVMLDGLDEVRDILLRETVVRRVADFFAFHRKAGNKVLITSRLIGYREARLPTCEGLAECTLVDFGQGDIDAFVDRWTTAIEKASSGAAAGVRRDAVRDQQELLEAIRRNPSVRALAANPLLLTILALMKRQGVVLPERRVELYQKYVETLLSSWNRARGLDRPADRDLDVVETLKILAPLALWMHEVSPGLGLVNETALYQYLESIFRDRGVAAPEVSGASRRFLADVREYAGLLAKRGAGQYGFIHLTFEEYLASVGLGQHGQQSVGPVISAIVSHTGDAAWREVSLLTIGYIGLVQQRDVAAGEIVQALLPAEAERSGECAVLAGEAVADTGIGGMTADARKKTVDRLLLVMTDNRDVAPMVRARTGTALGRIGDPRFRADAWYLPDDPYLGFVEVPAGPFIMGEGNEQGAIDLPTYWIGRFLVTNSQFAALVEAGGYQDEGIREEVEEPRLWPGGTVKYRDIESLRIGAVRFKGPLRLPNHPIVGVSGYEAMAYCRWLAGHLLRVSEVGSASIDGLQHGKFQVTLPSGAEWEKAARGTDGRIYPCGNDPDPNRANWRQTGLGTTSAVGCFPSGASPFEVMDMVGNVCEWTRGVMDLADTQNGIVWEVHGGSSYASENSVRWAYCKERRSPLFRFLDGGFRVALSPLP